MYSNVGAPIVNYNKIYFYIFNIDTLSYAGQPDYLPDCIVISMVRSFHVVKIVGTTCELVGTSRVCFNHVMRSRAGAYVHMCRETRLDIVAHYVIVLFHVVTCSTDAEPVCRAF